MRLDDGNYVFFHNSWGGKDVRDPALVVAEALQEATLPAACPCLAVAEAKPLACVALLGRGRGPLRGPLRGHLAPAARGHTVQHRNNARRACCRVAPRLLHVWHQVPPPGYQPAWVILDGNDPSKILARAPESLWTPTDQPWMQGIAPYVCAPCHP